MLLIPALMTEVNILHYQSNEGSNQLTFTVRRAKVCFLTEAENKLIFWYG
jgi:hypothetical protein